MSSQVPVYARNQPDLIRRLIIHVTTEITEGTYG